MAGDRCVGERRRTDRGAGGGRGLRPLLRAGGPAGGVSSEAGSRGEHEVQDRLQGKNTFKYFLVLNIVGFCLCVGFSFRFSFWFPFRFLFPLWVSLSVSVAVSDSVSAAVYFVSVPF